MIITCFSKSMYINYYILHSSTSSLSIIKSNFFLVLFNMINRMDFIKIHSIIFPHLNYSIIYFMICMNMLQLFSTMLLILLISLILFKFLYSFIFITTQIIIIFHDLTILHLRMILTLIINLYTWFRSCWRWIKRS